MTRDRILGLVALFAISATPIPPTALRLEPHLPLPRIALRTNHVRPDRMLRATTPPRELPPRRRATHPEAPEPNIPEPHTPKPNTPEPNIPKPNARSTGPIPDGRAGTPPPPNISPPPIPPPLTRKAAPKHPPPRRRDPQAGSKMLAHGLQVRDNFLGVAVLGSGDISRALQHSTRMRAPTVGRASFIARIASDGELLDIQLSTFSGKRYRWQQVAADAMATLRGRVFKLRDVYGSGVRIHIDLITNLEMPSGSQRTHRIAYKKRFSKWRWPWGPDHEANEAAQTESLNPYGDDIPPDPVELLVANGELDRTPKVKLGSNAVLALQPNGRASLTFVFDVSDIGAHPTRVVHTRMRVETAKLDDVGPRKSALGDKPDSESRPDSEAQPQS